MNKEFLSKLTELLNNDGLMEVGRLAVEDMLVELRDSRLSCNRNNGFCIREYDGSPSSVVRLPTESGIRIAIKAIIKKLEEE